MTEGMGLTRDRTACCTRSNGTAFPVCLHERDQVSQHVGQEAPTNERTGADVAT